MVNDGETGFLVPAGNVSVLAEKIVFLLKNQELSMRMGEAGYRKIITDFGFETQKDKLERIYERVLDERNCKPS